MMNRDESIDIEVVKQRFVKSEAALRDIAGQLESLGSAARRAQDLATNLEALIDAVRGFSALAQKVVEQLADSAREFREAVVQAGPLLRGEALTVLRSEVVSEIQKARKELSGAIGNMRDGLVKEFASIEGGLSKALSSLPEISDRTAELRDAIGHAAAKTMEELVEVQRSTEALNEVVGEMKDGLGREVASIQANVLKELRGLDETTSDILAWVSASYEATTTLQSVLGEKSSEIVAWLRPIYELSQRLRIVEERIHAIHRALPRRWQRRAGAS